MSDRTNNLALTGGNSWARNEHGVRGHNYNDWNRPHSVPRPLLYQPDERESMQDLWYLFEDRIRTGPFGLARFPSQPHSPMRILILDDGPAQAVNPGLQQFIRASPPRVRGQWQTGLTTQEEPGLTREEYKKAMKKLRKHIFSPTYPRKKAWKRGLFSRMSANNDNHADDEEDDDEGKQCPICLEAFIPNQEVLLTPCNHMFHKECIEQWLKSQGNCPVCRHAIIESRRQNSLVHYNNNNNNINDNRELMTLLRAMEEAFEWVNVPRR